MLKIDVLAYQNALRARHPVEKIVFSLTALLFVLISRSVEVSIFTFITMGLITVLKAKIPAGYYLKLVLLPLTFLFLSVIALMITVRVGDIVQGSSILIFQFSSIHVYFLPEAVKESMGLMMNSLSAVSCLYFLILTTPMNEILYIFSRLKLPSLFLELMLLSYRYIFLLLETAEEIYLSQQSRLGYEGIRTSLRSGGNLLSVLLIKTYQQAKDLEISMASRGGDHLAIFVTKPPFTAQINFTGVIVFALLIGTMNYFF